VIIEKLLPALELITILILIGITKNTFKKNNNMPKINEESEVLYDWLFHIDPYTKTANAYHREDYMAYWSGAEAKHKIHRSKTMSIDELAEYIKLKEK
jgi:hypothetical protein